jgi:V8-like Glu-specific endopeptidase
MRRPVRVLAVIGAVVMFAPVVSITGNGAAPADAGADENRVVAGSTADTGMRDIVDWEALDAAIPMPLGVIPADASARGYPDRPFPAPPYNRRMVPRWEARQTPLRSVGKLWFQTQPESSTDWYTCSATVVGENSILTAGHCVYTPEELASTPEEVGWHRNFTFVPAHDGTRDCPGDGCPYGVWDAPTNWYAIVGWTGSASFNLDLGGVIFNPRDLGTPEETSLEAAVGKLGVVTHWTRNLHWNNFGYPAQCRGEPCPVAPPTADPGDRLTNCQSSFAYEVDGGPAGPPMNGMGCDMQGGGSGGPLIVNYGRGTKINGLNSAHRGGYEQEVMSPYFENAAANLMGVLDPPPEP